MQEYALTNEKTRGLIFAQENGQLSLARFFGMSVSFDPSYPECTGLFFLDTDVGRFDGARLTTVRAEAGEDSLSVDLDAGDVFAVHLTYTLDRATGVLRLETALQNLDGQPHTVYAAMPRFPLQGGDFEIYGQYAAWCSENQGDWTRLHAGNLVLTNSAGRSSESATPFACVRHRATGAAAAIHVLPCGDWMIRARHIAGHLTSHTVLEAGLSDASLRMEVSAHETLPLPELLLVGFSGEVENAGDALQRYLLPRFGKARLSEAVYNTWFFDFDVLEVDRLREQVHKAKEIGCKTFVVDAGWFGQGLDWEHQVGSWNECTTRAFAGNMRAFADYVRAEGMGFGLWMEPLRACPGTEIVETHPEWFMRADTLIYDLTNPDVIEYLASELTRLVQTYGLVWMKLDYNSNMLRDLTGSNFYRYYAGERKLAAEFRRRNPDCSFEGCASGGLRTDIANATSLYHGHFVSDTVNPVEILRIRQNTAPRLLPAFLGSWLILHETKFTRGSYTAHDRDTRTKLLFCGDATWDTVVDVDPAFALNANLLGELGIGGDLASLSPESLARVREAVAFYEAHRAFMARTICHPLTKLQNIDDIRGWAAMQYENVDGLGSLLFVFRLVDDATTLAVYPKNLERTRAYRLTVDGEAQGTHTGAALMENGLSVTLPLRYQAARIEILPL